MGKGWAGTGPVVWVCDVPRDNHGLQNCLSGHGRLKLEKLLRKVKERRCQLTA
jgi:hypothetical protein